jgi:DNA-binding beta-propeller fold protein YncE
MHNGLSSAISITTCPFIYVRLYNSNLITLVGKGLSHPAGVAVDGSGNVYVADVGDNTIQKWTAVSNTLSALVSFGLFYPSAVAVDSMENVYFMTFG